MVWIGLISGVSWIWALGMNKIFGHSTYWKYSFKRRGLPSRVKSHFKRKPSNERLLDNIDEYVLKSAVKFLSIKDVLVLGIVNKSFNKITKCPSIWSAFEKNLFEYPFPADILSLKPKNVYSERDSLFFKLVVYHKVLANNMKIVLIHSNVYDVTLFISEHPGGDAVMREELGRDASKIFDLAHHSSFAVSLMEQLCIWCPTKVLGGKGIPARANLLKRELSEYLKRPVSCPSM